METNYNNIKAKVADEQIKLHLRKWNEALDKVEQNINNSALRAKYNKEASEIYKEVEKWRKFKKEQIEKNKISDDEVDQIVDFFTCNNTSKKESENSVFIDSLVSNMW